MIRVYNLSEGQEDIFIITIDLKFTSINILVDGGRKFKDCIEKIDNTGISKIDYIVLTHIDNDHIKGILRILQANKKCEDAIIVYNKFINGLISYTQAEQFEKLIHDREVIVSYKEYQSNSGDVTFLSVNQRMKLQKNFNEVYITFLGPSKDKVEKVYEYYKYFKLHNFLKSGNAEVVNRSSIIFILEYKNNAILMTGDGYICDILPSIERLFDKKVTADPIKKIDLIKIPHHGSKNNNVGIDELLKITKCEKLIITCSNNGRINMSDDFIEILRNKKVFGSVHSQGINKLSIIKKDFIDVG